MEINNPKEETFVLEYIWLDYKQNIRSKTRIIKCAESFKDSDVKEWNYDGSSTGQALSDGDTEVILNKCKIVKNPLRNIESVSSYLILCDTYDSSGKPLETNTRYNAYNQFKQNEYEEPWFGIEQEYFLFFGNNGRCFDLNEGSHYCGETHNKLERQIVEEHMSMCIKAGLNISGINAEVVEGQWEFQVGPCVGIDAADQLILARYLLERIAEKYEVMVCYKPKPILNKNGSGCHINFSTKTMRSKNGLKEIMNCMKKLSEKHNEHIAVYGEGNKERLTGIHETSSYSKFSYGVGTRNTSIRIPNQTFKDDCGYFEDRRPASNIDPYLATAKLFETCCLYNKDNCNENNDCNNDKN